MDARRGKAILSSLNALSKCFVPAFFVQTGEIAMGEIERVFRRRAGKIL